ncbi:MAG: hypothetical protein O3A20_09535 [Planctomycetota bacterium]|nr:hypothetical protein [Planctomycetota bacterium]
MSELPSEPSDASDLERRVQRVMSWVIVSVLTVFGIAAMIGLFSVARTPGSFWQDLIQSQFAVIVGLPIAGFGALFITLVLRISSGPIEFEAGPIRFKGGSAPIVFWVLCFMAMVLATKLLWVEPGALEPSSIPPSP